MLELVVCLLKIKQRDKHFQKKMEKWRKYIFLELISNL